jgi:YD repeat-containing protein
MLSRYNLIRWFFTLLLTLLLALVAHAQQQPITFQYFYDETGQLMKVVDSSGNVVEYVYDKVGNMLEIKRSTAASLAIFNFTPSRGPVTTKVTIQGQGFSANPTGNTVRFNGTSAAVTAATATTLAVTVPTGATTGPISVEVGGATTTSSQTFTVTTPPVITAVRPLATFSGTEIANFRVTGGNLNGSIFAFIPAFVPPAGISINSAVIDPPGALATLSLTVGTGAQGAFVLVATNAEGSSDVTPSPQNTLAIVDPSRAEEDSDGDGFPNGLEILLGSNPFDPLSVPNPDAAVSEVVGSVVSLVNAAGDTSITEVVGPIFSVVNTENPTGPPLPNEAVGTTISIVNAENPTGTLPNEAVGAVFSVVNTQNPTGAPLSNEVVGPTLSIRNQ